MKISTNWLKEYVDIDVTPLQLAKDFEKVGNELEEIKKISDSTNLVIGYVTEKTAHPDSDHLNVCMVDLGDSIYQIVCGAPNVDKGQKVIVAKVGAKLPNGIEIKKANIRGIESNGMICSLEELGIESKYIPEASKGGIHVLESDAPIGEDALKYLCYDDTSIDFELTADRSDLLSMLGMAYEAGAIYDKKVRYPEIKLNEIDEHTSNYVKPETHTDNCYMYQTRIVRDVVIKESPNFIKARLMACGIRPINNVVDISNYVMLEYGQPLHFFDYDKLGDKIIVRMANPNEKTVTLDGIERALTTNDIVITTPKEIVALAGVMGGLSTEVTLDTRNIVIESAIFNPLNVRYTSKRVLRSEASARFEKGIDPNRCREALNRAAYLLQIYADGKVLDGTSGFENFDREDKIININTDKINKVLGMSINTNEIKEVFRKLDFEYELNGNEFKVYAPTRRLDITIPEDLIEEVGRIHGYDNMIGTLPIGKVKKGSYSPKYSYLKNIHSKLQSLGLNEVITYSLINNNDINKFTNEKFEKLELLSPLSEDRKILRYSLVPSLLKVIDYNVARNIKDVMIYEIGSSYYKINDEYKEDTKLAIAMLGTYIENSWQSNKINADFYVLKGIIENLFSYLGLTNRYQIVKGNTPKEYHPGKSAEILLDNEFIGYIGAVHPSVSKLPIYICEINIEKLLVTRVKGIKFKEIPKYPSIIKDVAFLLDKNVEAINIMRTINKCSKLVSNVDVFDLYEGSNIGENKKSLAFKITFMDINKTLTDEEVNATLNDIIKNIESTYNAELRSK